MVNIVVVGNKAIINKKLIEYLKEKSSKKKDIINKNLVEYLNKKDRKNIYNSKIIGISIKDRYKNKRIRIILI